MLSFMERIRVVPMSAGALRREISFRGGIRGKNHAHEATYGRMPCVVFQETEQGLHGNFLDFSYQAILGRPEWARRLTKAYTAGRWVPRRGDRERCELDCANSSDALLMNVFCYPGMLEHGPLCSLLGVERGAVPVFGYKPRAPMQGSATDRTEVDMLLGNLLVEAKLTEGSFQTAPMERVMRYCGLEEVFDVDELPVTDGVLQSYQLVRGVMAAWAGGRSFAVFCDARRVDLVERWFQVMRAVRSCDLRSRLALVTWQEIAGVVPGMVRGVLGEKYGIFG